MIKIQIRAMLFTNNLDFIRENAAIHDQVAAEIRSMKQEDGSYKCPYCGTEYKNKGWFCKHLKKTHKWKPPQAPRRNQSKQATPANIVISTMLKMIMIARDTWDAYRMVDGDRVFRNAKLEFLYAYGTERTKYRLWLWNILAYEKALLTEREAFEYHWNISVNLKGGIGENMPNDDLCELQVKRIKGPFATQGPNKSFESAQIICKTSQVVEQLKRNLQKRSLAIRGSRDRTDAKKTEDVCLMAREVSQAKLHEPHTVLQSFKKFRDPLERIDLPKLWDWMDEKKKIAIATMAKKVNKL